ncbi:MAG: hypothetical protein IBGAMO2_580042 [Arenicellales bacterium IbO2]|nr:hypothetical protein [Gammaproteobacteria bacterium]MDA7994682.1 hypothetical protein [Gammaproteobacteria bacterium]MDA8023255.1 hypothetical protein [Gammaproteobacteria bacterium]MDA8040962.1 hypothetical protein [Pirellulales bacterium]CAJ2377145.1 MAG: hypothetical protein IBGAMO2_580042 [Arenicellales bacterium IbO2]
MAIDWDTCAHMLGRALSRYNGLTNSAKLDFIGNVVSGDLFQEKPFRYAYEVIERLGDQLKRKKKVEQPPEKKTVDSRSAEVHLHHAIAFGFLYRATPGGTRPYEKSSKRQEAMSHIALSALGRAYRSARHLGQHRQNAFTRFLWEYALLECDFDMYGLLLKMSEENSNEFPRQGDFNARYKEIQRKKFAWVKKTFPYAAQSDEITKSVEWIKKDHDRRAQDEIFNLSDTSYEHHYGQRQRWAKNYLGHIDASRMCLTDAGKKFAENLPPSHNSDPFFWLAPPRECAESHFLTHAKIASEPYSPAWNAIRFRHSSGKPASTNSDFVEKVALYMEEAYDSLRLYKFNQASLETVLPYIYFLEHELLVQVSEKDVLREVIQVHRDKFVGTVRQNLSKSHYWLRKN